MKPITVGVFFILAIIAGWFYWFEWRPASIIRYCSQFSDVTVTIGGGQNVGGIIDDRTSASSNKYLDCLHQRGLI